MLEVAPAEGCPGPGRAFIAPHDVKVLYEGVVVDEDLRANVVCGIVGENLTLGSLCRLSVETSSGVWQVEYPSGAYDTMDLKEGCAVRLAIRPGSVVPLGDGRKERER